MSLTGVELIGHRGAPREFPENSLPSFRRAFERGAQAIELDVHATRDGVVVVHHDPVVHCSGRPAIADLSWEELEEVELAPGIPVPRLDDVLPLVPVGGTAYVELKGAGVERAALDVIRGSGARCAVHSFDHDMVSRAAAYAPEVPRGILFDDYPEDLTGAMRRTGATTVWPDRKIVDADLVRAVHASGGRVLVWTVNSRREAEGLVSLGVDGLCTDDVRQLTTSG